MQKAGKVLVIVGPTAVGKTDLACQLAKKFEGELIAADSRQVYRGLDIGTGKYSPEDKFKRFSGKWFLNDVVIHGYDLVQPGTRFSAADFAKFFAKTVKNIWLKKTLPILVGGTGFYIRAALFGFETLGIPPNAKLRKQLEKLTIDELFKKLRKLDYGKAQKLSPSDKLNPRRLIRAIEVAKFKTSHKLSVLMYPYMESNKIDVLKIGLNCDRKLLYQRIDERVNIRFQMGMIEEIKNLLAKKINPNWLESLGLEYFWITQYLLGKVDFAIAVRRLKGAIHDFARRQLTWFKKDGQIIWFDITEKNYDLQVEKIIEKWLNRGRHADKN